MRPPPQRAPLAALALGAALAACGPPEPGRPRTLELEQVRPEVAEGVYLNEELEFHFSAPLDPSSVTHRSVAVVAADGRPARGELQVDGDLLRFVPARVLAPDLSDGGYQPDTEYTVVLAGFPRPDHLRSADGAPLARTYRWSFRTTAVGAEREGLVFDDASPERGAPLLPMETTIGPLDPLYLESAEPLDPSTLHDEDFALLELRTERRIPVQVRLVEVRFDGERQRRGLPMIEIGRRERLDPGAYWLVVAPDLRLRDYGQNRVWYPSHPADSRIAFEVEAREEGFARGRYTEHFLDRSLQSNVALAGYDGTAHWSDNGRVEVRYPAAAGDGRDGAVTLGERETRADVQAVELTLPAGRTCRLAPEGGLALLRCQGRMRIAGRLVREAHPGPDMELAEEDRGEETLSAWLERTRAEDPSWTVLIAGGDLDVEGELRVTTPLLLVAGGVVRVSGSVRAVAGELWLLGEGGGLDLEPAAERVQGLAIDPPSANPLVRSLRYAVVSGPIPRRGGVARWLWGEAAGHAGAAGSGEWRVRYFRETPAVGATVEELDPVDDPRLLTEAGPLQLLIELVVHPGEHRTDWRPGVRSYLWDPPSVDYVELTWEQASADGGTRRPR